MKVQVRFIDGEILDGDSEAATATRMGFPVSFDGGNNQIAWISMASIKYVVFTGGMFEPGSQADPRHSQQAIKVVLHFVDGETMRTYKDDTFSQEGEGFYMRIWDDERKALMRVLVSLHALKAIFFVNQWDARSEEEKARFPAPTGANLTAKASSRRGSIKGQAQRQIDELTPPELQGPRES